MLSDLFTRARKALYRLRGHYDGQLGGLPFKLDPYHSKFWRKASAGTWEPETFATLDSHLHKDRDYLDIGAWIGPTVLFGAKKARHVWCFEPDPVAFRHLAWNLELNEIRNVSAFACAISDQIGVARMASFGGEAGDSMTSLLNADGAKGHDVLTLGWADFARSVDLSNVSLVKMDIEGAEFAVLPTLLNWLQDQKPALFLSTHAPFLDADTRAQRMLALFDALSFYGTCVDDKGDTVTRDSITDALYLDRFPTFLFTP